MIVSNVYVLLDDRNFCLLHMSVVLRMDTLCVKMYTLSFSM